MGIVRRVAFDVTPVISGRTGIARYVNELGAALERRPVELHRYAIGRSSYPLPVGTRHVHVPARIVDRWWRVVPWPNVDRLAGDADVVHATGLLTPPTRHPLVVTVHDVAAVRYPNLHPTRHVRQQRTQLRALDRAAAILTVSQATADDLVHFGVRPERIVVAPLGLSSLPQAAATGLTAERKRGYLLTVGESSPRKRYDVVLRALSRVDRDLELVMAGPPAADEERLRSLVGALGLGSRVRRLGAVPDAALAGLYRDALALCFPSVAEGFGLPVLEAMAAGLPVVARDIPVARELAGDAAIYLAGDDERVWAETIEALVSDAALRERCSSAGRARAAEFTWDRTAAATLEAYRIAADGAP
jgi:glycosyltransferase involved in cell wall biosynthesis